MASSSSSSPSLCHFSFRKSLPLCIFLLLFTSLSLCNSSEAHLQKQDFLGSRRRLLAIEKEEQPKKKTTLDSSSSKNQTKSIKPIKTTTTNSTIKSKSTTGNKNQTKLIKPIKTTNSTKTTLSKTNLKNQTTPNSIPTKKFSDLSKDSKSNTPKNKTTPTTKQFQPSDSKPKIAKEPKKSPPSSNKLKEQKIKDQTKSKHLTLPNFIEQDAGDDEDLINEFRDLPSKFHEAILPDLEKISTTSKAYITKANQEITQGFKPLVGKKYASMVGSLTSCIFLLLPLLLVSLLFNRIRMYFSLQKILIFIQVYLAIYFAILSLAYFVSGIEPLKFFYATSRSSYITIQVFQTLGYVLYLLLQLMNLLVVFSTAEDGVGLKFLGLVQTMVGFAVGLHYYAAVFHRAVVGQPPKTSWKIHGIYATCFLVICLFARAERRKKAYLQDGSNDDCKKS
ncbi:uncharacterized protein LOC131233205 [Magnolia sinica]|uniref:uncharacterized protein LOC131233205 n=1 Tax=Magnolia sinica TaxID=86752 RepID=UPI002659BC75|nr:uncharacterized protein LOC131233205 [Magnolia sinica]